MTQLLALEVLVSGGGVDGSGIRSTILLHDLIATCLRHRINLLDHLLGLLLCAIVAVALLEEQFLLHDWRWGHLPRSLYNAPKLVVLQLLGVHVGDHAGRSARRRNVVLREVGEETKHGRMGSTSAILHLALSHCLCLFGMLARAALVYTVTVCQSPHSFKVKLTGAPLGEHVCADKPRQLAILLLLLFNSLLVFVVVGL